jgi:hypothetical protein
MVIQRRFSDPANAKAHADVIAKELAEGDGWDGYSVVLIDEHGTQMARVRVNRNRTRARRGLKYDPT